MEQDAHLWQRLEELFDAAVELPSDQQAAFVERETGSDAGLRRRLQGLLDHQPGAGGRIASAIAGAAQSAAAPIDWIGRRFGAYRIVREIGRGGMGLVFEGVRDDDEYFKTVAVKIAPWWSDLELLRERFRHERQILAGLEHVNIARFLDGGTQDGIPYFALEYVEGCPITEHAARRGLTLREKIKLFQQVCAAVHYAHQSLLVHRDLKPGNILVNYDGVPKLLDFGIAKLLSPLPDAADNTLTGTSPWTPDYASPEQVRSRPITTRTDIYSLGLILFELLTGERAQVADSSSPLALDRSICEVETPRPSERAPRVLSRQLAGDLDTIVGKATHKDPERRYDSAAQFSEDLERYLTGRPVMARKDSAMYRASKFLRRNWLPAGAAAVAILSLIAGAAGFAWQARVANRRFDQVRKLATVFLFDVHDKMVTLAGTTAVRETLTKTAVESLAGLSRDAGRNYPLRRELATAYLRLGTVQGAPAGASLGHNAEALASFQQGISLLQGMPQSELRAAAETEAGLRQQRGLLLDASGRRNEAEADLQRALEIRRGLCQDASQQPGPCESRLKSLMALADARVGRSAPETIEATLREMDQSLESLRPGMSPVHYQQQWLRSRIYWSRLQYRRGGREPALEVLGPVWPMVTQMVSTKPDDMDVLRTAVNYCDFYGAAGDPELNDRDPLMDPVLERGVEWSRRLMDMDRDDIGAKAKAADLLSFRGMFVARDNPAAGAPLLRQALRMNLEQLRLSPANVNTQALAIAKADALVTALVRGGRPEEAVEELRPVLEFYNPLQMIGLNVARTELVREIQAMAWVAQTYKSAIPAPRLWAAGAAQKGDAALAKTPSDPAMQAAVAGLFDALPGGAGERTLWWNRAADLWQALARRFPDNPRLRPKQ